VTYEDRAANNKERPVAMNGGRRGVKARIREERQGTREEKGELFDQYDDVG